MTAKKATKKDLAALLAEEAEAIDANRDAPITDATTVTRGHGRSKTLQIRLNPEEIEELERVAASRGLPTSTVAREAILRLIRPAAARSAAVRQLVDDFARYLESWEGSAANASREQLRNFNQRSQTLADDLEGFAQRVPAAKLTEPKAEIAARPGFVAHVRNVGDKPVFFIRVSPTDEGELRVEPADLISVEED